MICQKTSGPACKKGPTDFRKFGHPRGLRHKARKYFLLDSSHYASRAERAVDGRDWARSDAQTEQKKTVYTGRDLEARDWPRAAGWD